MIAHLVLFRPHPHLDPDARASLAEAFAVAIREIKAVRQARVGVRVVHGRPYEQLMREDYTHIAILEFDDRAGLLEYLEHPAHGALAARFFVSFEQALIYDFELGEGASSVAALLRTDSDSGAGAPGHRVP